MGGNAKRYIRLRQLAAPDANRTLDEVSTITWFTGNTLITLRLNHTLKTWRVRYQQASIREPAITDKM